ncbi:beta-ketoacyl synthase N-terminal-like domain-containing protein [Micromonospora matsumotoense]
MTAGTEQYVAALRNALREVDRLRGELDRAAASAAEPIAVVGLSCRFAGGADTPDRFWDLLDEGRDAVGPFPTDRGWPPDLHDPDPAAPGHSYVDSGGFLPDVAGFDAGFFGVSPREALAMDPQQRMLLELAWTAIEDARIDPERLRATETGVYVGTNGQDYPLLLAHAAAEAEGFLLTGNAASVASGRISYVLGLTGPSLTVDTACSSALVAVHQAVRALRSGEVPLALVGAATVMSTPVGFTEFSRQRGLAADGRCKPFSAAADGVGWGEGGAVLLLERLGDALAHGRTVHAVLRGSAVNSDGASNGLTAPNGPAQRRVIERALADAGLTPGDVDAVEAHGTGTRLGDPIEAEAILASYGRDRERPLWLGSVKSNLGHTQAAAGLAGLIKLVLALRHGRLPRTLHAAFPTTGVRWGDGPVRLLTAAQPWPRGPRPRRAAVSAFGISGTNAHVVVEEPPAPTAGEPAVTPLPAVPCLLSAADPSALREQARGLATLVRADPTLTPAGLGLALATGRAALRHRACVTATDRAGLLAGLTELADSGVGTGTSCGGDLAVLFTGQGAQRTGMGLALAGRFPAYAEAFAEVCGYLDPLLDRPLATAVDDGVGLDGTGTAQPAIFAVEVALYRLLGAYGLAPAAVAGHSVGELAAVHVAGALSLADAATVVAARGRLMAALPTGGAMLAVRAGEAEVTPLLDDDVELAAVNGPRAVVLSGTVDGVERAARLLRAGGHRCRRLDVSHAFHSRLMEPALAGFAEVVAQVRFTAPRLPVVSTLTGAALTVEELAGPAHWVAHARRPVRFADAVRTLEQRGVRTFLEVGPAPALTGAVVDCLRTPTDAAAVPTLRPDSPDPVSVPVALGALLVRGHLDRAAVFAGTRAAPVALPTYPFRRTRFWPDVRLAAATGNPPSLVTEPPVTTPAPTPGMLRDLVLRHVAAVLGHGAAPVDPHCSLAELGLTSLSAVELRDRLAQATGLPVGTADLLTAVTPDELAGTLAGRADGDTDDGEVRAAFAAACVRGDVSAGLDLLAAAADRAPTGGAAAPATPLVFAEGAGPQLVCLPSMVAPASPYQYARLLACLDRPAVVAPLPGYRLGEALPVTRAEVVDAQVAAVRAHLGDRPYVLVGYSSGGWLAHAAAAALHDLGAPPERLVLVDVHVPGGSWYAATMPTLFTRMAADRTVTDLVTDRQLLAMGRHLALFADWRPQPLTVPVTHLRAAAAPGGREQGWAVDTEWRTVPGDHLGVLTGDAPTTAAALADCLRPDPTKTPLIPSPTGRSR